MKQRIQKVQLHYMRPKVDKMPQVLCSADAAALFRSVIDPHRIDLKEFFFVMLLTHVHQVLGISEIAIGDTQDIAVCKKEIFQLALMTNASAVILCHNHPSGMLQPSKADITITNDLITFGTMIGVRIIEHIILTSEDYYSMVDTGTI